MNTNVEIVNVDATNVTQYGFFCYKSKPKSEGYRRKLDWLEQRFSEGMRIKIVYENGRAVGFIEYTPGEFTWRALKAENYLAIHCLWVVGRGKGKGYGSRLLNECVEDARNMQKHGVAMVTKSSGFLAGKKIFLNNGFELVDRAPPSFELVVRKFSQAPSPAFPKNWEERAASYGSGLTVIRSDQCPYIEDTVNTTLEAAGEMGITTQVVELTDCQQVQDSAPSAYGIFNVVYDGQLLTPHPLTKKQLLKRLDEYPK